MEPITFGFSYKHFDGRELCARVELTLDEDLSKFPTDYNIENPVYISCIVVTDDMGNVVEDVYIPEESILREWELECCIKNDFQDEENMFDYF